MDLRTRLRELRLRGVRVRAKDDLALDAEAFAARAKEIFATHPLRVVRLWKATGKQLADALATPELGRVRELHLSRTRLTADDVEALIYSPYVGGVVKLELGFCGLGGRTASLLATADPRRFASLREVSLFANKIGNIGVRALADALLVAQLTHLDLEANHAGDEAIAQLLASPAMRNMERLIIARNEAAGHATKAFLESEHALRLTMLDGLPGPDVAEVLARNAQAARPWTPPPPPAKPLAAGPPRPEPTHLGDDARGRDLVAQIAKRPDDGDLRAVYADWLQERGDIRGELIALASNDTEDPKLRARVKRLRSQVEKEFRQQFKNKSALLQFDRGLIVSLGGQLRWLLEHGSAILEREPVERLYYVQSPSAEGMQRLPEIIGIDRVKWICVMPPTPKLVQAIPWDALPNMSLELRVRGAELGDYLALPERNRIRRLDVILTNDAAIYALARNPTLYLDRIAVDRLTPAWQSLLTSRFGKALVLTDDQRANVANRRRPE